MNKFVWAVFLAVGTSGSFAQDADPAFVAQARALATARSEASFVRQCTMEPARFPGLGAECPIGLCERGFQRLVR